MAHPKAIYLIVSGASAAKRIPNLLPQLIEFNLSIYTILTRNAHNILSAAQLADIPGHTLVESYFDPSLIQDREPGLVLVAPATFNTVNKISQGIADTLAHSLVAEAIGSGWPVIIAPSMNPALASHPQTVQSFKTLRDWGITVLDFQYGQTSHTMASVEDIIEAVKTKRNEKLIEIKKLNREENSN